jgi:hypothetical protein
MALVVINKQELYLVVSLNRTILGKYPNHSPPFLHSLNFAYSKGNLTTTNPILLLLFLANTSIDSPSESGSQKYLLSDTRYTSYLDLDDLPFYNCLSYTWGNSFPADSSKERKKKPYDQIADIEK